MPISKVILSEFGVGAALDVKGNLRVYDVLRF